MQSESSFNFCHAQAGWWTRRSVGAQAEELKKKKGQTEECHREDGKFVLNIRVILHYKGLIHLLGFLPEV